VGLGLALRGIAPAAIDLSDGLLGDLGHVLERSGGGAEVEFAALPRSTVLAALPEALQLRCLLSGGDDYELLFTAPAGADAQVLQAARQAAVAVHRVGRITAGGGLTVRDAAGQALDLRGLGSYDHFAA
jgi:thiamine-monophosphate kinase